MKAKTTICKKLLGTFSFLFLCFGLLSTTQASASAPKNFKVVAYYPSWTSQGLEKLRFDVITHVNYAFAIPTSSGSLRPLENPTKAKQVVKKAHKNKAKALLAVGGWSYNGTPLESTFRSATSTKAKRTKLIHSIVNMANKYEFDGVDLDWEYPNIDDSSYKQYEQFIVALAKELHSQNKLLTCAVVGGVTADGVTLYNAASQTDKVIKAVDWINVMAYDGGDGERHSSYKFATNCASYWKKTRSVPASKIVLGVPFYGRPTWTTYEQLLQTDKNAYKKNTVSLNGTAVSYNGMALIKNKTIYAKKNLGGIMIWEITQDTTDKKHSLLTAIQKGLQ